MMMMMMMMTLFLGFTVQWQMNITDIDDKIILKARRNELLKRYKDDYQKEKVFVDVDEAVSISVNKVEKTLNELKTKLKDAVAPVVVANNKSPRKSKSTMSKREIDELDILIKQAELKLEQALKMKNDIADAETDVDKILEISEDVLADWLDSKHGHEINDHQIFVDHARKYEKDFFTDMSALKIREPDIITRVTEYVPEVVAFIEKIIEKGIGYESNGSVYFDTEKHKSSETCTGYPKLVPAAGKNFTDTEIAEGEGALGDFTSEKVLLYFFRFFSAPS
jgi:cysteinyl-tRNA synthetase